MMVNRSSEKKLKDFPEKERSLWRIFDQTPFEDHIAVERTSGDRVLQLIDYPAYFELLGRPLPANRTRILEALASENLICRCDAGDWNITNLGAILFAKKLGTCPAFAARPCESSSIADTTAPGP